MDPSSVGDRAWRSRVEAGRRDLDLGGRPLHLIDLGEGPPVLAIHGFADSCYTWHRNDRALREAGLRTVLVDQPGLGRSAPTGRGFGIEGQARAILAAADALGLERFHLLGHSMGGAIALFLALRHGDRVGRVAALAPACYPPRRRLPLSYPGAPWAARRIPLELMIRGGLRDVFGDRRLITAALVAEYTAAARRPDFVATLTGLSREFFSPAFERMCASYESIPRPLSIVWGEADRWLPAWYGERLCSQVPGARLRVLPAGHMVHQERADEVNGELGRFFAGE